MKLWSKALRIVLALAIATQGTALLPAMAASQGSKRLAVKAIGEAELKIEFGAGGGGGGGDPDPNPCGGASQGLRLQGICNPNNPPVEVGPPPVCATDLDSDGFCDVMGEEVALIQDYGSGTPAYKNIWSGQVSCDPYFASPYCTIDIVTERGVSATVTLGVDAIGTGLEISASSSVSIGRQVSIERGSVGTAVVEKQGTKYWGNYKRFAYYDRNSPYYILTKTGEAMAYSSYWERIVWRQTVTTVVNKRPWWQ